jgi:hypothetical protein
MQREKLYNLHKTIYFIVVLFGSRVDKILAMKLPSCEKDNFFDTGQIKFLLFHRCITKIVYHKGNKIYHKMQPEKLYNLHSKAYCRLFSKRGKFFVISFCNTQNQVRKSFVYFENKKYNYEISGPV